MGFEWDDRKDGINASKHGFRFTDEQEAFFDQKRIITKDIRHSTRSEERYFCIGETTDGILTARFTMRSGKIRIFGAGYWREGKGLYEQTNKI